MNENETSHEIDVDDRLNFILAGRAVFTLESPTGRRFTYRVVAGSPDRRPIWFVGVLTGQDNTSDYSHACFIGEDLAVRSSQKAKISWDAPSLQNFRWLWSRIVSGRGLECSSGVAHVYHVGRCGRCGRELTVPESVKSGLGPSCRELVGRSAFGFLAAA